MWLDSFLLPLLGLTITLYTLSIPLFWFRRSKFPISQRVPELVLLEMLAMAIGGSEILLRRAFPMNHVLGSCVFWNALTTICADFATISISLRVGWIFMKDLVTQTLVQKVRKSRLSAEMVQTLPKEEDQFCLFAAVKKLVLKQLSKLTPVQVLFVDLSPAIVVAFADIVVVTMWEALREDAFTSFDCDDSMLIANIDGAVLNFYVLFCLALIVNSLRNIRDNFNMMTELKMLCIPGFLQGLYFVIAYTFGFDSVNDVLVLLSGGIIAPLTVLIQTVFPLYLSYRFERKERKHQAEGKAHSLYHQMQETLDDPILNDLFERFLEKEFCVENLFYYMECREIEKMVSSKKAKKYIIEKVREVRDTYIRSSAINSVNISSSQREKLMTLLQGDHEIEQLIMRSQLSAVFLDSKKEIFNLMAKDAFLRFKLTEEYIAIQNGTYNEGRSTPGAFFTSIFSRLSRVRSGSGASSHSSRSRPVSVAEDEEKGMELKKSLIFDEIRSN
jgi:hypothetical protein